MYKAFFITALSFLALAASAAESTAITEIRNALQLDGLDAKAKGLAIAKAVDELEYGFGDSTVSLSMKLTNRHGQSSSRIMKNKTLEVEGDGDKTLIIFESPRDVKGTALLSFTHKVGDDDQWLYLPAIKRVKRIASKNKSGPFVGSEFAYEDLTSQEVEKFTYEYKGEATIDGIDVWLVNYDPVDPNSGYSVREVAISKEHIRFEQVKFYDRKGDLLKVLRWKEYKLYKNRYWRAHIMHMVNKQKGGETLLKWNDYVFDNKFTEKDFSQQALKRAR